MIIKGLIERINWIKVNGLIKKYSDGTGGIGVWWNQSNS